MTHPFPPLLRVVPWRDPTVEHAPGATPTTDPDALAYWTPSIGPTAALIAARWARDCARHHSAAHWRLDDLAATFGVSPTIAARAVDRLDRFGIITRHDATIAVRLVLPPLPGRLRERLPASLAVEYDTRLAAGRAA